MKRIIRILFPLFFAAGVFFFYLFLYPSPVWSESFAGALLLFFTALGGGGVLLFSESPPKIVFLFYFSISIAIPFALVLFSNVFPTLRLKILLGVMVTGLVWLKIFVAAHYRHERGKD